MPEFSVAFRATKIALESSNRPLFELQTGPTASPSISRLFGCVVYVGTAAQMSVVGIGTPAAAGIGSTSPCGFVAHDQGRATEPLPGLTIYTDWTTEPTVPAKFLRRTSLESVQANSSFFFGFAFPAGLKLAPSTSLVGWIIAVSSLSGLPIIGVDLCIEVDA